MGRSVIKGRADADGKDRSPRKCHRTRGEIFKTVLGSCSTGIAQIELEL
jgi:hypothetical protein